jgi:ADP-ribose pyrophosphatase
MAENDGKQGTPGPAAKPDRQPAKFQIRNHRRVHENFLILDQAEVSYERFDGTMSKQRTRDVCERGDSAAALLYDPDRREVILVNQFRLPTTEPFRNLVRTKGKFASKDGDHEGQQEGRGWLLETAAGTMAEKDTTPDACIRREITEEVGYEVQLNQLQPIARFFSSPGGSSEMIHLFYAEVSRTERKGEGGGASVGEDIRVVRMGLEEFFSRLELQQFQDPKIIIAGYWLRDRLARRRIEGKGKSSKHQYRIKQSGKVIGIATGSMIDVEEIEAWVNPENTNMIMDRPFARTVSAAIRWHGARHATTKDGKPVLGEDLVADALRRELDGRSHVKLTEVLDTDPGELRSKGAKRIFHVAIADGFAEQGLRTDKPTLEACMDAVLERIAASRHGSRLNPKPFRSVLIPMIGAGQGGLPPHEVAPILVERAAEFFKAHPKGTLEEIYLCAYTTEDRLELEAALAPRIREGFMEKVSSTERA